jgi:hypothetical protein
VLFVVTSPTSNLLGEIYSLELYNPYSTVVALMESIELVVPNRL